MHGELDGPVAAVVGLDQPRFPYRWGAHVRIRMRRVGAGTRGFSSQLDASARGEATVSDAKLVSIAVTTFHLYKTGNIITQMVDMVRFGHRCYIILGAVFGEPF